MATVALLHGLDGPTGIGLVQRHHLLVGLAGMLTEAQGVLGRCHTDVVDLVHGILLHLGHGGIGRDYHPQLVGAEVVQLVLLFGLLVELHNPGLVVGHSLALGAVDALRFFQLGQADPQPGRVPAGGWLLPQGGNGLLQLGLGHLGQRRHDQPPVWG